jgi:hypothetical protein
MIGSKRVNADETVIILKKIALGLMQPAMICGHIKQDPEFLLSKT